MANVTDSFNRADAGTLGTADSGQTWANFGGGGLGISSNTALVNSASADTGSVIDGAQADATWKVTLVDPTAVSGGLIFRYVDPDNFWVYQTVGGTTMNLRCRAGGVSYTVDLVDAVSFAPGDVLEVVTSGDSIIAKFNGVEKRSITDATHNTATQGGLLARPSGQYDDFSITGAGGGGGNTAPTAAITAPATGTTITEGDNVNFTGTGTDTEDGALTGASLAWTSDLDGALGTGTSINVSTLSVGTHTITLTATDSGALSDTDTITITVNAAGGGGTATPPALPRTTPSRISISGLTYESTTTVTAATIQATIDAKAAIASAGHHLIIVQDGELITTSVVLPQRAGTGYIVLRSETLPCLEGIQVHPSMITTQAEFRQTGSGFSPIIYTETGVTGVDKYILAGLNVTSTSTDTNMLVALGDAGGTQNSLSLVPEDFQIDRCVIIGDNCRRALTLHSGTTRIVESYLLGAYLGADAQAIQGANGPGPYLIEHNALLGSGENVMFGGQSNSITDMVPSDITIRLNYFGKPLSWLGHVKSVKNILEFKYGQYILVEGNFFENNWGDEQSGMSILFKSVDQNGLSPWVGTFDLTFRYNYCRNMGGFVNLSADPEVPSATDMCRVSVHDNVGVNIGSGSFEGDDRTIMMAGTTTGIDYRFQHNTVALKPDATQSAMAWLYGPLTHCKMTDNIDCRATSYGVRTDGGSGSAAWDAVTTGESELTRNVIGGQEGGESLYPANNYFPASQAAFGFVDDSVLTTLDTADPSTVCDALALDATSAYKGLGSGGSDPGADLALVKEYLQYSYVPGLRSDDFASFAGPGPNPLTDPPTDPPVATSIALTVQPADINSGATVTVAGQLKDQFGADFAGSALISLAVASGSGSLSGDTSEVTDAGGAFSLSPTVVVPSTNALTLTASSPGLTSATTDPFTVTAVEVPSTGPGTNTLGLLRMLRGKRLKQQGRRANFRVTRR